MSAPLYRHNLSISEALSRSGVKGGPIPGITQEVVPVALLADFSQVYSGPTVEARAYTGRKSPILPPGRRWFFFLPIVAPGGAVVDEVRTNIYGASVTQEVWVDIIDSGSPPTPATFFDPVAKLDTGGTPTRSIPMMGDTIEPPSGVGPFDPGVFQNVSLHTLYVPSGGALLIMPEQLGEQGQCFLTFREVPAPVGLP